MTTLQLAQLIARRTAWKTVTAMPVEDQNALVVAINQGCHVWFQKASGSHTAQPRAADLRGPVVIQGTATNGSTAITLTSPPSWLAAEGLGSSVQVSNDHRWNRLMSLTSLHLPFTGPTGAVTFTVYHDVAPLGGDTVSICSRVKLVRGLGVWQERELVNDHIAPSWMWEGSVRWQGDPTTFAVEPLIPGVNSTPFFVLRVWPVPTHLVSLSFDLARYWSMTMPDLMTPRELPFPEDVANSIVLPIALDRAAGQDLLKVGTDFRRIAADAQIATDLIYMRTMNPVTDPQWHGTPTGY